MNYTARQLADIINDALERNILIAKQQGVTFNDDPHGGGDGAITLEALKKIHRSVANNLGQILRDAMGDADL